MYVVFYPSIDSYCQDKCGIIIEEKLVRGVSLSPLIKPNDRVRILFNYYKENEIKRGDVVAYNVSSNEVPIIKIIKDIPDDKFYLRKTAGSIYHLVINNEVCVNSEDTPYLIDEQGAKMLSLYEKDCNGIVPENVYLLLGNLIYGSLDSTRFGLVSKDDILGKVEL